MKNKILIVIIVLILLLLGGLGYYTFFVLNKDDTKVVEKIDLSEEEISIVTDGFYYDLLLNMQNKKVEDLTEKEVLYIGYYALREDNIIDGDIGDCDYNGDADTYAICIARNMGLAEKQIEKMDTSLWSSILGGSTAYEMFSKELLESKISDILGIAKDYDESFDQSISLDCGSLTFIYDNNINMFFVHGGSGCTADRKTFNTYPIEGYKESDSYVITVVKGILDPYEDGDDLNYNLYAESDPDNILANGISIYINGTEQMDNYLKEFSDKLDNYKITFKKVGNNYQFVSIDYVE